MTEIKMDRSSIRKFVEELSSRMSVLLDEKNLYVCENGVGGFTLLEKPTSGAYPVYTEWFVEDAFLRSILK